MQYQWDTKGPHLSITSIISILEVCVCVCVSCHSFYSSLNRFTVFTVYLLNLRSCSAPEFCCIYTSVQQQWRLLIYLFHKNFNVKMLQIIIVEILDQPSTLSVSISQWSCEQCEHAQYLLCWSKDGTILCSYSILKNLSQYLIFPVSDNNTS